MINEVINLKRGNLHFLEKGKYKHMITKEMLEADYQPTVDKILSKSEITKWLLSTNYKRETKEDIDNIFKFNPEGISLPNKDSNNKIHIKELEKIYGEPAEYMNPISRKYKLYKYKCPDLIYIKKTGWVSNKYADKWMIIQSVGGGYFIRRTDFNSYKFIR